MHKHINVVTEEIIAEVSKSCMQSFSVMTTELHLGKHEICDLNNKQWQLILPPAFFHQIFFLYSNYFWHFITLQLLTYPEFSQKNSA